MHKNSYYDFHIQVEGYLIMPVLLAPNSTLTNITISNTLTTGHINSQFNFINQVQNYQLKDTYYLLALSRVAQDVDPEVSQLKINKYSLSKKIIKCKK